MRHAAKHLGAVRYKSRQSVCLADQWDLQECPGDAIGTASGSQRLYNIDASDASNMPNIVVPASHMDVHTPGWWETCVYKHAAGCNKLDSTIDPTLCDKVHTANVNHGKGVTWRSC